MKKVVFVDPEGIRLGLNIGLAYLAANLEHHGYRVDVLDFNNERRHQEKRLEEIIDADIVGISIKTFTVKESLRLASRIKGLNPHALLICGGPHLSTDGYNFLKENKIFRIGVIGEGEQTILELASDRTLKDIDGIIYNTDTDTVVNRPRPYNTSLDALPFPNYNLFNRRLHNGGSYSFPRRAYPLLTSRGCPFRCIYCVSYLSMGRGWRPRSVINTIEELKKAKENYDIREFEIHDDSFNIDVERAKSFCRQVKSLNLRWSCPSGLRADFIDSELVTLMKDAGCYYVYIGIETGDENIYRYLDKGGSLRQVKEAVALFKSAGIRVAGAFIIGLPHSTKYIDEKSVKYARKIKLDISTWAILHPYYGTPLYDMLKKDRDVRMLYPWQNVIAFGPDIKPAFETTSYSEQERREMYYRANLRSKAYVAFIKQNGNAFEKIWKILVAICRYDPVNLFYHLFWAMVLAVKSVARRLSLN